MRCRIGLHKWLKWYQGWAAPDMVTYGLSKCFRCGHIKSTYLEPR